MLLSAALAGMGGCERPASSGGSEPPNTALASPQREQATPFSLKDLNGKTVTLADYKGRVVFLDFWATWCPPCRASVPAVESLHKAMAGKDVQILGMNLDEDLRDVPAFVKKKGITYPVLLAGESDVSEHYNLRGIPHFILIDRSGRVAEQWVGFAPGMDDQWRRAIQRLLAA